MRISTKPVLAWREKADGTRALMLRVILDRKKIDLPLGYSIPTTAFNKDKVRPAFPGATAINLVIDKAKGRVNEIASQYYLTSRLLTIEHLAKEFSSNINRNDFISFARQALELRKLQIEPRTYEQNVLAIDKLEEFKNPMLFSDLTEELVIRYVDHAKKKKIEWIGEKKDKKIEKKGNSVNTISKTLVTWNLYLRLAAKAGMSFNNPFEHYQIKKTVPHKVALTTEEVKKLFEYYRSDRITPTHHKVLRYFLFSCRTGLRISDITRLQWGDIHGDKLLFKPYKTRRTDKKLDIPITSERELIPEYTPARETVFECFTDQVTNRILKLIGAACGIQKRMEYHMSRHTFGTSFLEGGGSVEVLQDLMGHSDIKTTMVYVHMTDKRRREQKTTAFGG